MPFWKKSEDPWDIDPEKRRREPIRIFEEGAEDDEAREGFFDELAGIFKKKPVQEENPLEPETCPWCGRPMERAYLYGGRDKPMLCDEKPSTFWGTAMVDTVELCDEGFWVTHKSCWQCKTCRKVVIDFPEPVQYEAEGNLPDWTAVPVKQFSGEEEDTERQEE